MTQIKYKDGRLKIIQAESKVDFKISDLTYEAKQQLINSVKNIKME